MRMARLIISTLPDRNSVAAFVSSEEGEPKLGLGVENFRVCSATPGADGSLLSVAGVSTSGLRGLYVLELAPIGTPTPRKGLYVFDLIVETGEERGQVMSSAIMT